MSNPDDDLWARVRRRWTAAQVNDDNHGGQLLESFQLKRWLNPLAAARIPIAVTGMRGAGKSTLADGFAKDIAVSTYRERGMSSSEEARRVLAKTRTGKKRFQIVVVPGQKNADDVGGLTTFDSVFGTNRYPDGVVYLAAWGYSRIWGETQERAVLQTIATDRHVSVDRVTLEDVRNYNLTYELADFQLTCEQIKRSWANARSRRLWLVIAVSKADLFPNSLSEASHYYIPAVEQAHDSQFAKELRSLVGYIGESRLSRLAVVPISTYPREFSLGHHTVYPAGGAGFTRALLLNFRRMVGEFCDAE